MVLSLISGESLLWGWERSARKSPIFLPAAAMANGPWCDGDVLLPHNFARHALVHSLVGMGKVDAMKMHLDATLAEPIVEGALFADVLNAGEKEDEVNNLLKTADAVLDFSASVPVARKLALAASAQGRRASVS